MNNKKSQEADALLAGIAQNINFLLKKNKLDPQTLSALTGLGIATINTLRRGVGNPTIATLSAIADIFGVQVTDIIAGDIAKTDECEETISAIPLVRYDELDGYLSDAIRCKETFTLNIENEQQESLFAVAFSNGLLAPWFDGSTTAIVSRSANYCDSDIVLVKLNRSPFFFRQIFFGDREIYFTLLGIDSARNVTLSNNYAIAGVVIKTIRDLK
ncbi:hypothetical protein BTJ39_02615 [Izhakiella australiensis]|uniref:HTH cro/C1-type domain-containing protein n=1 Tax=Izhakiella australiensis TaxID=1926881 RepID=A0A1S8YT67_9GAMM|nr:helix-turn-helix transcriptional regulator [Izhakiella australiensis]OON42065.1 hypothetical protein BTJ39_02615 [Izhakiella australiensis]